MKNIIMFIFVLCFGFFVGFLFFQKNLNTNKTNIENIQKTVVSLIESKQEIITKKMTIQKTIKWKKDLSDIFPNIEIDNKIWSILFKDEMILMVEAEVLAGFDMSDIGSGIVVNSNGSVDIYLSEPKILYVNLTKNTFVQDRKTWIFTKWDIELETKIRNLILEEVKNDAISSNILQDASIWVKNMIQDILKPLDIKVNNVSIKKPQS